MSERQVKRQRRAVRKAAASQKATTSRPPQNASPHVTEPPPVASSHLAIALSAAVPLRVLALYERKGPDENDLEAARQIGTLLASKGDRLLFRSEAPGETGNLFNQVAQALAVLSFAPNGMTCFGQNFEALSILTGFFGEEAAKHYCQHLTGTPHANQSAEAADKTHRADSLS